MNRRVMLSNGVIYSLIVAMIMTLVMPASQLAQAESLRLGQLLDEREVELSPGATYTWRDMKLDRGYEKIHSVSFNLANHPHLEMQAAMTEGKVWGMQQLSEMASLVDRPGNRVIAGINGDYYDMTNGTPLGFFMTDGRLLNSPDSNFAFGLKSDGTTIYSTPPQLTKKVTINEEDTMISHINRPRATTGNSLNLYTVDYHTSTMTNDVGTEVVATILSGEVKSGQTVQLQVAAIHPNKGNTPLLPNQVVLSATGSYVDLLRALEVGQTLSATFELEEAWQDVTLAIGGYHMLLQDGVPVEHADPAIYPRTVIGTKADHTIVMLQLDGRQPGFSEGVTLTELIKILQDMDVVNAVNLDGGGSATFIAKLPGQTAAQVMNSPSDGSERKTANGLLLVNKAAEGGVASKLAMMPTKEKVLVGNTVKFQAFPQNEFGHATSLTGPMEWTVDETYGVVSDGVFTAGAVAGYGTIQAQADAITGMAEIEVVDQLTELVFPDKIKTFSAGESVQLSVTALRAEQVVQAANNSFSWRVEGDIGSVDEHGKFTAEQGTGLQGRIYVAYGDVETYMDVAVGKPPIILEDFENGFDRYLEQSGDRYNFTRASITNDEEYVRSGNGALKLEYDFIDWPSISGSYLTVKSKEDRIEIPDYPERIGMWVYGDGMQHWLRAQLIDANGGAVPIDFVDEGEGVNFTGWRYLEAEVPKGRPAPLTLDRPVRYMSTKVERKSAGVIYVDDIRAMYGPATEDLTPPIIRDIQPADGAIVQSNMPKIQAFGQSAQYDPQLHPATTLIDPDKLRLYVDDVRVQETLYPPIGQIHYTPTVPLADGMHKVELKIRDLAGNRTEQEWYFTVDTGSAKLQYTHPEEVYAGNRYELDITAYQSQLIATGHVELQLDASKMEDVIVIPNEALQAEQMEYSYDAATGLLRVSFLQLDEAGLPEEATLATLQYTVKADATESLAIGFVSGGFQLRSTGETSYNFYQQPIHAPIKHHLQLQWNEFGVVEGEQTVFTVTNEANAPVEGAIIRQTDGTELGATDSAGELRTSGLTGTIASYALQAVKDKAYSPIETFKVSKLTGSSKPYNISVTMWENSQTSKAFNWHTHPSVDGTVVEIVKAADFTTFEADNVMRIVGHDQLFNTVDTGTVRVHKAEATELEAGTTYVYRVGDGKQEFSSKGTFTTASGTNESTKFLFMGDSQANNETGFGLWGSIFEKALADHPDTAFVVHGGDLVEDGYKENEWNMWFTAAQAQLQQTTIVPVVGNHEVTGARQNDDYLAHFNHPQNGIASLKGSNFSFDYNNAHFVVLNSEYDLEEQKEWLREDLKNNKQLWTFVAFHRGPYGSMYDSKHIRDVWTPIFDEFQVDVVMNGHDHVYVRSWPMKDMQKAEDGKGTIYIVGGSTGPKFYQVVERDWQEVTDGEKVQMYVAAEIINNEVKFVVKTINDRIVDEFTLVKTDQPSVVYPPYPGNSSGGNETGGETPTEEEQPATIEQAKITMQPVMNETKQAAAVVTAEQWEQLQQQAADLQLSMITLQVNEVEAATAYSVQLPAAVAEQRKTRLQIETPFASWSLPPTWASVVDEANRESTITFVVADLRNSKDEQTTEHAYGLTLMIGEKRVAQLPAGMMQRIVIPYETVVADGEVSQIVIAYYNEAGEQVIIPNGYYDASLQAVIFDTNHLGTFAVSHRQSSFADIHVYPWAKQAIEALAAREVVKGVGNGQFAPAKAVTRAEFVTMLTRALPLAESMKETESSASIFADIDQDAYYYDAVTITNQLEIVTGVTADKFEPQQLITREQMFAMIARALAVLDKQATDQPVSVDQPFTDYEAIAPYARPYVDQLVEAKLVEGSNGKLTPKATATRAETATVIYRLLQHYMQ